MLQLPTFLPVAPILNLYTRYTPIPIGTYDTMGMHMDLFDISEGETEEGEKNSLDRRGKFISVFTQIDSAIVQRVDIINKDGYNDPNVVYGILTGALTDGMKERARKMLHFQRFIGLKQATLMVKIYL